MNKKYLITILFLSSILQGCFKETGINSNLEGDKIELNAQYPNQTRANGNSFENEDRMGVFVLVHDSQETLADNIQFQYDSSADKWIPSRAIYWPSGNRGVDIIGYYPFVNAVSDLAGYKFTAQLNQSSSASYEASDLLLAKVTNATKNDGAVYLSYSHLMAGLSVRLLQGAGFSDEDWINATKQVFVKDAAKECMVNLASGIISEESGTGNIIPLRNEDSFKMTMIPKNYAAGTEIFSILVDGREYIYKRSEDTVFSSGKMHGFTITVDRKSETGEYTFMVSDESITPWQSDAEIHDGIVRNYVNVNVEVPGTFQQTLASMGLNYTTLESIKVSGRVDDSDLMFMGDMPSLTSLNMSEMIIDNADVDNDYVIPYGAFWGSNLVNLVLPTKLKRISMFSFYECALSGTIIFPEGLEEIESYAFTGGINKMKIILPSTIKRIGDNAFGSVLKGEVALPDGLEYVGDWAMGGLSGTLRLPSTLNKLGTNCFMGEFSGGLTIPSKFTVIPEDCMSWARFLDGTLILPEGLVRIEKSAFETARGYGFTGELILPSTVEYIGDKAFQCHRFSGVTFPDNLTYIGIGAFFACNNLSGELSIPDGVKVISSGAFKECINVTSIRLPKNLEMIGAEAFAWDYSIREIICESLEPPLLAYNVFDKLVKSNVTVQVPKEALSKYKSDRNWSEFPRIVEYRDFECQPSSSCSLSSGEKTVVLSADADWILEHKPDWVTVYPTSGSGKTMVSIAYQQCNANTQRTDSLVFKLRDQNIRTYCRVSQYGYGYQEDEIVTIQKHSSGDGINIYFMGDGWDAESIGNEAYLDQCRKATEYLFSIPPYDRLREYFNVYAIVTLSQETGLSTLTRPRDTRLGVRSRNGELQLDEDKIFDYITSVTGLRKGNWNGDGDLKQNVIVVLSNSTESRGATYYFEDGSAISICPQTDKEYPNDFRGIVQHEVGGRNFGKLAEEGIATNGYISKAKFAEIQEWQGLGYYQNISVDGKASNVPWAPFIFDPKYSGFVDMFEGAYGYTRQVWRSESESCMGNSFIPYYNAISRYEITRRVMETSKVVFDLDRDFFSVDTNEWGKTNN